MTIFQLTMTKDNEITVQTSGSRLDLIMSARIADADSAIIVNKDCGDRVVWQQVSEHKSNLFEDIAMMNANGINDQMEWSG